MCVCVIVEARGREAEARRSVEILYLTRRPVGALQNEETALHVAADKGHDSVVQTLLKAEGCDVNAKNNVRI